MRARVALLMAGVLLTAACGSGDSILRAGREPVQSTVAPSTLPGETTLPPTTQPTLLDTLPQCKPEALDAAAASGPVEITFWHGLSNELGRELERITNEFNASQSRVRVNLQFQGGYEQNIDKYLQSTTENRPDLVQMPEYTVQLMVDTKSTVPAGACMEATGYDTTDFLQSGLDYYATEGVQWAMPFNISNPVLYYNKKMFEAAGLDPEDPPATLAEVSAAGLAIQQSGAGGYGIALDSAPDGGGGWALEQWMAKEGAFYSDNGNGRVAPSTRVLFDGDVGVELMTELRDVVQAGGGVFVGENPGGQDNLLKLADATSPAAMTIATSAALGPVLQFVEGGIIPGVTVDDMGVAPMPSPGGQIGALVGGAALWIVADRGDAKAAAAWEYVQHLLSPEIQSQWAAATGYVPVRQQALDFDPIKTKYADDPRFKVAYDQLLAGDNLPEFTGPVLGPLREVRVVAAGAMTQVFNGADPAQALAEAAEQANALIADYNSRRT